MSFVRKDEIFQADVDYIKVLQQLNDYSQIYMWEK